MILINIVAIVAPMMVLGILGLKLMFLHLNHFFEQIGNITNVSDYF